MCIRAHLLQTFRPTDISGGILSPLRQDTLLCCLLRIVVLLLDIDTLTTIHICVDVHIVQYKSISLYKYPDGTLESLYNH